MKRKNQIAAFIFGLTLLNTVTACAQREDNPKSYYGNNKILLEVSREDALCAAEVRIPGHYRISFRGRPNESVKITLNDSNIKMICNGDTGEPKVTGINRLTEDDFKNIKDDMQPPDQECVTHKEGFSGNPEYQAQVDRNCK